jgi:hypothetical protein
MPLHARVHAAQTPATPEHPTPVIITTPVNIPASDTEICTAIPSLSTFDGSSTASAVKLRGTKSTRRTKKRRSYSFSKASVTNEELKPIMYVAHRQEFSPLYALIG